MIPAGWAFATISELGQRLRHGEVSASALTEFCLQRLETIGGEHKAVVTLTRELALEQARQADADLQAGRDRGPLHGIPYVAKDLLATRGIPTTWGAEPFRDQVFDADATVIRRLRDAGAVLTAKVAMVELAGGFGYQQANCSLSGPTGNAWNRERWAGGSSSGSGTAVGAGLVPFAIGSETSGSIVTPAGFNGITGLRPTYGRVPRTGAMALAWSLDKLGPMCRSAADCGLVLQAIAGPDGSDFAALDEQFVWQPEPLGREQLRIGIVEGCLERVQPEIQERFEAAVEVMRQFAMIETVALPDLPYGSSVGTIITGEMAAAFEEFIVSGRVQQLTAPEDRWGGYAGMALPAKDYINAQRVRRQIQVAMQGLLNRYPILIAPTLATVAGPIDRNFADWSRGFASSSLGTASNAAGVPGITVPMGPGADGLPTGLQLVAAAGRENFLLTVADQFQQRTAWHRQHPAI